jgi:shikimate kinase
VHVSIVLIGYRGSGKTTIGRRLADRLWWKFVDADEQIVARAGRTIREIFDTAGEAAFRDLEAEVVAELMKLSDHVISLGGGAVMRPENREAIKHSGHAIIYLKCDPAVLHERITADAATAENRPALTSLGGSVEEIEKLLAVREPVYREMMTAELEVTNQSIDDAVNWIARLV